MKKFSKEHQWIELANDGTARVGITKFAAAELGEVTFVELPDTGKTFKAGEQLCSVESVKACSDVFMPAGATVLSVNETLEHDTEAINSDPEGQGFICIVKDVIAADLDALMDETQYMQFVK